MLPPPIFIGPAPKLPLMKRKTMKTAILGARALAIEKARVAKLEILKRSRRPYISDKGESTSGPNANPSTYIETTRDVTGFRFSWNSSRKLGTPGTMIDDSRGLKRLVQFAMQG